MNLNSILSNALTKFTRCLSVTWCEECCKGSKPAAPRPLLPALVIFPCLLALLIILSYVALLTWLAADWPQWFHLVLPCKSSVPTLLPHKFIVFQSLIVSACTAGLGGTVFMIREFYIRFAYGQKKGDEPEEYLQTREISRFLLLPFSSIVLGPVSYALVKTGAVTLAGSSAAREISVLSSAALSFILGFTYHDTLNALSHLSKRIFTVNMTNDRKRP
jgi:hypothetical protein